MASGVHWAVHAVVPFHQSPWSRYRNISDGTRTTTPAHGATERLNSMRSTRPFTKSPSSARG